MHIYIFTNLSYRALSGHLCVPQAGTTCGLRSFLVANSTQNYFLIAHVLSFFVTFATKVTYLTFCDKKRQSLIKEMDRVGGNKETRPKWAR